MTNHSQWLPAGMVGASERNPKQRQPSRHSSTPLGIRDARDETRNWARETAGEGGLRQVKYSIQAGE